MFNRFLKRPVSPTSSQPSTLTRATFRSRTKNSMPVVSIDAFEYFGTDVHFLPKLLRVLKRGGPIGVSTPGLRTDPYEGAVPAGVSEVVGFEAAAWHSPEWWQRHWELTAMVDEVNASWQPRGYENWLLWAEAVREHADDDSEDRVLNMLRQDGGRELGFVLLTARRR